MKADRGLRQVIAALVVAAVSFWVVAAGIYYERADVRVNGWMHGGPTTLLAAMAGLFCGGLVAVVVLILLLRWLGRRG
jgi:hypothetical protein